MSAFDGTDLIPPRDVTTMKLGRLAVVLVATVLTGGCLGVAPAADRPADPSRTTAGPNAVSDYRTVVLNRGVGPSALVEGSISAAPDGVDRPYPVCYATLVTSPDEVDRLNGTILERHDADSLADDVDFDGSYPVVVEVYPHSSYPDYRIERVTRSGETLDVRINGSWSREQTADLVVESLLIHAFDNSSEPPDRVVVTTHENVTFDSTSGVIHG